MWILKVLEEFSLALTFQVIGLQVLKFRCSIQSTNLNFKFSTYCKFLGNCFTSIVSISSSENPSSYCRWTKWIQYVTARSSLVKWLLNPEFFTPLCYRQSSFLLPPDYVVTLPKHSDSINHTVIKKNSKLIWEVSRSKMPIKIWKWYKNNMTTIGFFFFTWKPEVSIIFSILSLCCLLPEKDLSACY